MQTSKGLFVWCGNREQRISYNLCLDCQGIESTTCFEQIEKGKQIMALGNDVKASAMVNTVSEILFLSEIKKLNELGLNRHKDIKDLLTIMDERLQRIETMLKTPNVLVGTAKKKDETPTTTNTGKVTMTDSQIIELANSVQKEHKMNLFLETFRSKYPNGFKSVEECDNAVFALWQSASEGHKNPFWVSRSSKAMKAILAKAFVTSGKANTETKVTKEKDSDYFIKSFKEVTEEKLKTLAQLIEDQVSQKEMIKLSGNVLFDSQSRAFILEYFNEDKSKRLDKIYPPEEIKAFLSFLTQFVVREE